MTKKCKIERAVLNHGKIYTRLSFWISQTGNWVQEEQKGKARQNSNAKTIYNFSYIYYNWTIYKLKCYFIDKIV